MSNYGFKYMGDKLTKILWFYSTTRTDNYYLFSSTKQELTIDAKDLSILQHLLVLVGEEKGFEMYWLENTENYMKNIKYTLSEVYQKQHAIFNKYKPSQAVLDAEKKFREDKREYKFNLTDDSYETMVESFKNFFDLL